MSFQISEPVSPKPRAALVPAEQFLITGIPFSVPVMTDKDDIGLVSPC